MRISTDPGDRLALLHRLRAVGPAGREDPQSLNLTTSPVRQPKKGKDGALIHDEGHAVTILPSSVPSRGAPFALSATNRTASTGKR